MAKNADWYVYALMTRDESGSESVFYVGKGRGHRYAAHLDEWREHAESVRNEDPDAARRASKKLRAIESAGANNVKIRILANNIETEDAAFAAETAAINALDPELSYLTNKIHGHGEASMVYDASPIVLAPDDRLVLVKIDVAFEEKETRNVRFRHMVSASSSSIYKKTRKWWPIAAWRIDDWIATPDSAPTHVLGIYHGMVFGVYPLDHTRWNRVDRRDQKWALPTRQPTPDEWAADSVVRRYRHRSLRTPNDEALFLYRPSGVRYWNLGTD